MRLLSLNLGGISDTYGSWATRAARIGKVISENSVDVLVAQAAPLGDDGRFAPDLHMLMPGHDDVAIAVPGGVSPPTAMTIVSNTRLSDVAETNLSKREGEDPFRRKLLAARLPEVGLTIVNAHFSWVEDQAVDNVREALAFVAAIDGDVLLMGDMNQPQGGAAMAAITAAGFVDCWQRSNGGEGLTFESGKLWGRIDYIWERAGRPRVRSVSTVGGPGEHALSDHFGLLVELA